MVSCNVNQRTMPSCKYVYLAEIYGTCANEITKCKQFMKNISDLRRHIEQLSMVIIFKGNKTYPCHHFHLMQKNHKSLWRFFTPDT